MNELTLSGNANIEIVTSDDSFITLNQLYTNTMKTTFTFYSLLWFGSTLWPVSNYFIDSETTIKWYCTFWGAVIGIWIKMKKPYTI